jgi:hypothetical protein
LMNGHEVQASLQPNLGLAGLVFAGFPIQSGQFFGIAVLSGNLQLLNYFFEPQEVIP